MPNISLPKGLNTSRIAGIVLIIVGIIIFVWPNITFAAVAVIAGIGFLVTGVNDIMAFIKAKNDELFSKGSMLYAVADIVLGVILLLNPVFFGNAIPWLAGIILAVFGAFRIYNGWRSKDAGDGLLDWGPQFVIGALLIISGIAFIFASSIFGIIVAIFLIIRGIMMVVGGGSSQNVFDLGGIVGKARGNGSNGGQTEAPRRRSASGSSRQAPTQRTARPRSAAGTQAGGQRRRSYLDDDVIDVEPSRVTSVPRERYEAAQRASESDPYDPYAGADRYGRDRYGSASRDRYDTRDRYDDRYGDDGYGSDGRY